MATSMIGRATRYLLSPEYRFEHSLAKGVMKSIPQAELAAIREKYQRESPGKEGSVINHSNTVKYLDAQHWLEDAATRAIALGLHKSPGLEVLDLGCGAGWFLAVARELGHSVLGLDLDDNNLYNDTIALLGIDRVDHCINAYQPLPDLGRQFDVITGYMVWFNWAGRTEQWDAAEWTFFLDDCRSRLKEGGRIFLQLNPGRHPEQYRYLPDDTAAVLRGYPGATVWQDEGRILVETGGS